MNLKKISGYHLKYIALLGIYLKIRSKKNPLKDIYLDLDCAKKDDTRNNSILALSNERQFIVDLIDSMKNPIDRQNQLENFFSLIKGQNS